MPPASFIRNAAKTPLKHHIRNSTIENQTITKIWSQCAENRNSVVGGHLEKGTRALTFFIITLGILPDSLNIQNF
jgi:hypothetical protein